MLNLVYFSLGVAVVTILDNTVGGFLTLSFQRIIGTVVGGVLSIIVMTIVRAIFQPQWDARAAVLLCFFMFAQVFVIARLKQLPNYSYAGGIVNRFFPQWMLLTDCLL